MGERAREIQLRGAERTWATLRIEPAGRKLLCHELSVAEIAACPPLLPFEDGKGLECNLIVSDEGPCVEIVGANGRSRLRLVEGYDGELAEVEDPSGDAQLVVTPAATEGVAISAIHEGRLVLKQCRIKSDPQIMMGKPVIRGTRITVEFLLRRIAGGATEDELVADFPQLSREDIQEALIYAARFLSTYGRAVPGSQTPAKS